MEKSISNETWAVSLRGNINLPISEEERDIVHQFLESDQRIIQVRGRIISREAILFLCTMKDLEEAEYKRRGFWQCKRCGYWWDRQTKKCSDCYY